MDFEDEFGPSEEPEKLICTSCRRKLDVGQDVIAVEKCVVGMRGIVPLDANLKYCSEACLIEYFDDVERVQGKRRIP